MATRALRAINDGHVIDPGANWTMAGGTLNGGESSPPLANAPHLVPLGIFGCC